MQLSKFHSTGGVSVKHRLGVGVRGRGRGVFSIALFTVNFSHLHYNVFERGCEAISGNFGVSARNCLTSTFKYIVMQMRKVNCEKGYCFAMGINKTPTRPRTDPDPESAFY